VRFAGPTAHTRLVALLGHPVGHSISPQIHTAAFDAAGVDAVYLAFDVAPAEVGHAVAAVGALRLLGANVTVPHKRTVYRAVPDRTPEAEACGAGNTLFWDGDRLTVDNTDVAGLTAVLAADVGLRGGEEVLMLGAGGAARAAAVALGRLGCRLEVVARSAADAGDVSEILSRAGGHPADVADPALVINATPLGLGGERLPDRLMRLRPDQVALDLIYGPADTPFLAAARMAGAVALDGRGMLVEQAAAAFERWTGVSAPREAMRAAAFAALDQGA